MSCCIVYALPTICGVRLPRLSLVRTRSEIGTPRVRYHICSPCIAACRCAQRVYRTLLRSRLRPVRAAGRTRTPNWAMRSKGPAAGWKPARWRQENSLLTSVVRWHTAAGRMWCLDCRNRPFSTPAGIGVNLEPVAVLPLSPCSIARTWDSIAALGSGVAVQTVRRMGATSKGFAHPISLLPQRRYTPGSEDASTSDDELTGEVAEEASWHELRRGSFPLTIALTAPIPTDGSIHSIRERRFQPRVVAQ